MTQSALLLINPNARRGAATQLQVTELLQRQGLVIFPESAANPKALPEIIRAYGDRINLVIVGGGDGTVNAAIAGLLDTQLPLGVLPLGTANNLARTLGIPQSLPEACEVIAQGKLQAIDLGWVNGQYFLNVAGLGLSTKINREVPKQFKRRWGVIAYAVTALKLILKQRRFRVEIHCNGEVTHTRSFQITVCNGRFYGSGLTVAADAAIDDQRLDLCSLEVQHWWEAIALIPHLYRGEYATGKGIRILQGQDIKILTRKPRPIDTDGEITTQTPATFRVLPDAIRVCVP
ncbi:MAG: lipid kinase [Oculatellaceae cyanobacterium Prado106]|nr:lipid kinase [Oculatellaceae cyanobacterium Prado106]